MGGAIGAMGCGTGCYQVLWWVLWWVLHVVGAVAGALVGAVVRLVVSVGGGFCDLDLPRGAAVAGGPRSKVLGLISGGVGMGPARWWPWVGAGWLRCGAGGVGIFLCLCLQV